METPFVHSQPYETAATLRIRLAYLQNVSNGKDLLCAEANRKLTAAAAVVETAIASRDVETAARVKAEEVLEALKKKNSGLRFKLGVLDTAKCQLEIVSLESEVVVRGYNKEIEELLEEVARLEKEGET